MMVDLDLQQTLLRTEHTTFQVALFLRLEALAIKFLSRTIDFAFRFAHYLLYRANRIYQTLSCAFGEIQTPDFLCDFESNPRDSAFQLG
jgi:hypothetical protein